MDFTNHIFEHENLPDELLSEGVASSEVRGSDKILNNMKRKSFTPDKNNLAEKFEFVPCKTPKNFSKESFDQSGENFCKKTRAKSYYKDEEPFKYLKKSPTKSLNESPEEIRSLKSDISSLLRQAARLRNKSKKILQSPKISKEESSLKAGDCCFVTMKDIGTL
ncbi:unnamed protein product [Moneuplotes crassus]|uniref:Uncharacterized protein n=1 Tax=Euplotes crassus TaxID=5936 RepID=A0AAD1X672_EUPCR|nr:unnamed protein product [Moneuplotes crassus]